MLNILVVDDDENTLIAQEALLENAGYNTTTAWGGEAGIKALESSKFDLLLLDDYLPGVDAAALVTQAQSADLPVLVLSTRNLPPGAMFCGCETVHKWTPAAVKNRVDCVLRQRQKQKAHPATPHTLQHAA